jgi:hypothetical protein
MPDIIIQRTPPSVDARPALTEALQNLLSVKFSGFSGGKSGITVHVTEALNEEEDNAVRQLVLTHDYATRTAEQQADAQAKVDLQDFIATAQTMLAEIDTDNTALAAAGTARDLAIIRNNNRTKKLIKGFLRIARRID